MHRLETIADTLAHLATSHRPPSSSSSQQAAGPRTIAPTAEHTDQAPPTAEHSLMPATLAGRRILPTAERLELLESSHTLHRLETIAADRSAERLTGLHRSPSAERRHRLAPLQQPSAGTDRRQALAPTAERRAHRLESPTARASCTLPPRASGQAPRRPTPPIAAP